jgi:hypothetical protein
LPQLIYKDPPDRELIEWAIQKEEWDFVTTCLGTGAISHEFLPQSLMSESGSIIEKLYSYARRGDKTMVQWVIEASRKGSLTNGLLHTGVKYTGMRNLYIEFHESGPQPSSDYYPPSAAREAKRHAIEQGFENKQEEQQEKEKESANRVSKFFSGLRRKKSSTTRPSLIPTDLGSASGSNSADLRLTPTSTNASSSHSPAHLRTPSFGSSSFDTLLNRVASGRNGTK